MISAVAEGLHDLLRLRGEPVRARELRLMMPVSVRIPETDGEEGNRVAPAFVDVPVGPLTPKGRLAGSAARPPS